MAKTLFVLLSVGAMHLSAGAVLQKGNAFLGSGMQPEVVAKTLASVEEEWRAQAAVFTECNATAGLPGSSIVNCADAPSSFGKSCGTVVSAIVQGSGGDRAVAKEYMTDVCSQGIIKGWHQQQCHNLATAVQGSMSADKYSNRANFNTGKLCTSFWSRFLGEEQQRLAQEKAEREAAEKKAAEEEKAEREAAEKKAAEEAERKKKEEALRAKQEAEAKAAEAKAKAAEAAARVAQKKAEAEAVAQAAKQKMEEAKAAELEKVKAEEAKEKAAVAAVKSTEVKLAVESKVKPSEAAVKPATKPVSVEAKPAADAAKPIKVETAVKPVKEESKKVATAAKTTKPEAKATAAKEVSSRAAKPLEAVAANVTQANKTF